MRKGKIVKIAAVLLFATFSNNINAQQNVDLLSGKEFAEMSRLNPAFTSILNELRFLSNKSGELNLGLEGKLFKTPNHFGFYFQQNDIDQLRRQQIDFQLARDKKVSEKLSLKYALQLEYSNKKFNRTIDQVFPLNFSDYNGQSYLIDSTNIDQVIFDKEMIDVGLGIGGTFKNLLFGANFRHLNQPNTSILKNNERKLPIEMNAQLGGFISIANIQWFPHAIFSSEGDDQFLSAGLSATKGATTFVGQYEQIGTLTQFDLGINYRTDRFMFAVNYVYPNTSNYEFSISDIRFTLNTTLRKRKALESTLMQKLKSLY